MDSDNNKKNNRIVKNTIVLYFRMLFLMAISLYTGRVVLDVLGIDDYGIYKAKYFDQSDLVSSLDHADDSE